MTTNYETRNVGFASFLRYVLGSETHLSTKRIGNGYLLTFNDPDNRAPELQKAYFSQEGALVDNAYTLLECSREISQTVIHSRQFGEWEKPE